MTSEQALTEMLAWANGEKSHWNSICRTTDNPANEQAECVRADSAETQKWASVYIALVTGESFRNDS